MSWLNKLFSGFRNDRDSSGRLPSQRIYLVDASGLVESRYRNGNSRPSPREHFLVLKSLVQFAARECVEIAAVFQGRPLREAGNGSTYKDIKVFYVDDSAGLQKRMIDLIRQFSSKKDIVVLTSNSQLEENVLSKGALCMRLSTLKKGMEDRDDRDRRSYPNHRSRRAYSPQPKHRDSSNSEATGNNGVLDLIDPI